MKNIPVPKRALLVIVLLSWTVSPSSAATDHFVGKWKLNPSHSTIADQMSIQPAGDNKYSFTFSGAGAAETVAADGTDQPALSGTTLSVTVEEPNTWKIVRKMNGRILLTAIWNVSKDGKTLTDAFTSNRDDGSTSTINMLYKRTAGGSGIPGTWETTDVKLDSVYELEIRHYDSDGLSFISPGSPPKNVKFDSKEHADPAATPGDTKFRGRRIGERSLEFTTNTKGKVVQTRNVTLSPDFKTLTIVVHLADQRLPNTLVFDRV